jgi:Matrixin
VFQLHAVWSSAFKTALNSAAANWAINGGLYFSRGADATTTNMAETGTHIVFPGQVPSAYWDGCPPATTLACTASQGTYPHLIDSDTVFNSNFSFGTGVVDCLIPYTGHIAGSNYDVKTVALHEFGHWGFLGHSSDAHTVMYTSYNGCKPNLDGHDNQSMNTQYYNQGHP